MLVEANKTLPISINLTNEIIQKDLPSLHRVAVVYYPKKILPKITTTPNPLPPSKRYPKPKLLKPALQAITLHNDYRNMSLRQTYVQDASSNII